MQLEYFSPKIRSLFSFSKFGRDDLPLPLPFLPASCTSGYPINFPFILIEEQLPQFRVRHETEAAHFTVNQHDSADDKVNISKVLTVVLINYPKIVKWWQQRRKRRCGTRFTEEHWCSKFLWIFLMVQFLSIKKRRNTKNI